MALRGMDGFDHYSSQDDLFSRKGALQWIGPTALTVCSLNTPGRGGFGKSLALIGFSGILGPFAAIFDANYTTLRVGCAVRFNATGGSPALTVTAFDPIADIGQCSIVLTQTGLIRAFNGAGTEIGVSANNAFNPNVWSFLEVAFGIGAAGSIEVQIDGASVLTLSGVDTQASANNTLGGVAFAVPNGTVGSVEIDDFRYSDTTIGPGTYTCDSWLGDLRVATLPPIADAGVSWTPLSGANWQEVSELSFDGDASYNATTTVTAKDLFTLTALAATISQVIGLQLTGAYRATDTSPHSVTQQISSGGTEIAGPAHTLAMAYQFFSDLYPVNPVSGASWTLGDVHDLLIGYVAAS